MNQPFDYSLHDASIEAVSIGPGREINLELELGSARFSDDRLPEEGVLQLGGIQNFEDACAFFETDFGPDPIARIDFLDVVPEGDSTLWIAIRIDPQGEVVIVCSEISLIPIKAV